MARVGSSAKFCVVVFKSPLLWYLGVGFPLAKVGSSATFFGSGMQVISALVLGVHWPD